MGFVWDFGICLGFVWVFGIYLGFWDLFGILELEDLFWIMGFNWDYWDFMGFMAVFPNFLETRNLQKGDQKETTFCLKWRPIFDKKETKIYIFDTFRGNQMQYHYMRQNTNYIEIMENSMDCNISILRGTC